MYSVCVCVCTKSRMWLLCVFARYLFFFFFFEYACRSLQITHHLFHFIHILFSPRTPTDANIARIVWLLLTDDKCNITRLGTTKWNLFLIKHIIYFSAQQFSLTHAPISAAYTQYTAPNIAHTHIAHEWLTCQMDFHDSLVN